MKSPHSYVLHYYPATGPRIEWSCEARNIEHACVKAYRHARAEGIGYMTAWVRMVGGRAFYNVNQNLTRAILAAYPEEK